MPQPHIRMWHTSTVDRSGYSIQDKSGMPPPHTEDILEDLLEDFERKARQFNVRLEEKDLIIQTLTKQLERWKQLVLANCPDAKSVKHDPTFLASAADQIEQLGSQDQTPAPANLSSKLAGKIEYGDNNVAINENTESTKNEEDTTKEKVKARIAATNEVILLQRILGNPSWKDDFEYIEDGLDIRYIHPTTELGARKLKTELLVLRVKDSISQAIMSEFYNKPGAKLSLEFAVDINRNSKKSTNILTLKIKEVENRSAKAHTVASPHPPHQRISSRPISKPVSEMELQGDSRNDYFISSIIPIFLGDTPAGTSEWQLQSHDIKNLESKSTREKLKNSIQGKMKMVVDTLNPRKGAPQISTAVFEITNDGEFAYIGQESFFKWKLRQNIMENEIGEGQDGEVSELPNS